MTGQTKGIQFTRAKLTNPHTRAALSLNHDAESFRFWKHLCVVVHMLIWGFGKHFRTMR